MSRFERIRAHLVIEPGPRPGSLAERDPAWVGGEEFEGLSAKKLNHEAKQILARGVKVADRVEMNGRRTRRLCARSRSRTPDAFRVDARTGRR
jgi:hypothetical protein